MTEKKTAPKDWENLPLDSLIEIDVVAEMVGCSTRTIDRMLKDKELPEPAYFGKRKRWRFGTVLEFVRQPKKGR